MALFSVLGMALSFGFSHYLMFAILALLIIIPSVSVDSLSGDDDEDDDGDDDDRIEANCLIRGAMGVRRRANIRGTSKTHASCAQCASGTRTAGSGVPSSQHRCRWPSAICAWHDGAHAHRARI